MARRSHFFALLALVALIVAAKLGQQAFRWYAHAEEREQIRVLQDDVEAAGLAVIRSQTMADSLRNEIASIDRRLEELHAVVRDYESRAEDGTLARDVYALYTAEVDAYNRLVTERNRVVDAWEAALDRNREAVDHYNHVAEEIRQLAFEIGFRYYSVPTPIEIAVQHGLLVPDSAEAASPPAPSR